MEKSLSDALVVNETDLLGDGDLEFIDLASAGGCVYALSPRNETTAAGVGVLAVSAGRGRGEDGAEGDVGGWGVGRKAQGSAALI